MRFLRIIFRAFENAYRSVASVKWKSSISIMTILIGSLAITSTFTISQNIDGYIQYLVNQSGGPKITAYNLTRDIPFTLIDMEKFRKISIVKMIYGTDESDVGVRFHEKFFRLKLHPVTPENASFLNYQLTSGQFISSYEQKDSPNTIVLSEEALKLFSYQPQVNSYVNIKLKGDDEIRLKVIGIARSKELEPDLGSAWVNFPLYRDLTGRKFMSRLQIYASSIAWLDWLEKFGKDLFSERFGNQYYLENPLQRFIDQKNQMNSFIKMGYILGFLSLIAGSIGSTSVMILNVNLRKREIGLYKAMGFSPAIILFQFSLETLILSLFGGALGAISGSFLGLLISKDLFPVANLSLVGFLLGLGSALVTGMIFGLVPAIIASKIDPVKALQG